jgi:LysM repeat protein
MSHPMARGALIALIVAVMLVTAAGCVRSKPERMVAPGAGDAQPPSPEPSATAQLALPVVGGMSADQVSSAAPATPTVVVALTTEQPAQTTAPPVASATAVAAEPSAASPGDTVYSVRTGDTLVSIAEQFGSTQQAILDRNGLSNPSLIRVGQTLLIPIGYVPEGTPTPTLAQHTVAAGETLSSIARTYNTTPDAILAQNPALKAAEPLAVGTILTVTVGIAPEVRYHQVKAGETLSQIAVQYGLTSSQIARANGIADPNMLRVGQRLIIPW